MLGEFNFGKELIIRMMLVVSEHSIAKQKRHMLTTLDFYSHDIK